MNQDPFENTILSESLVALLMLRFAARLPPNFQANDLKLLAKARLGGVEYLIEPPFTEEEEQKAANDMRRWAELGIWLIPISSSLYPRPLREIHNPPPLLFARGKFPECGLSRAFAIVGSRRADFPSLDLAHEIAGRLVERGICIASGLALGVDAAAHRGALQSSSPLATVAVMGGGLDAIYPRRNESLARDILDSGGLLLSQFEPGTKPFPQNFLNRNRVIAGISEAVIVVSAGKRSGSLSTARHAMEEGRDVYVVPGFPANQLFSGSNRLIQSGAALVTSADDILAEYPELAGEAVMGKKLERTSLTQGASELFRRIQERDTTSVEELLVHSKEPNSVCEYLLELELKECIRRLPGNRVASRQNCK